ncbi:methyl-accepting chemotaxis protein [Bosea sp. OAE506]|uniref:HAMP domain-containing methyl-accepting chemotaxis protein n=1 Tax=Bosea sp. OAE506 TaxID=2663870 RepID=UPI00178AC7AF
MTVRSTLIACIAGLAAVVMVSLGFALIAIGTMARDEHVLTDQVVPTVSLSGELSAEVVRRHLLLNMHVNSSDPAAKARLAQNIDEETRKIDGLRLRLANLLTLPENQEALKRYEVLKGTYITGLQAVLAHSTKGDRDAAIQGLLGIRDLIGDMDRTVATIVKRANERAASIGEAANQTYRFNLAILSAIGLFAGALAVGAIWFVVTRVIRPLVATTKATEELAAGNLDISIGAADRSDEIGTMAKALGVFRDNLRRVRDLEEHNQAEQAKRLSRAASMAAVVSDVGEVVAAAAAGDFSARLQITDADEEMQKLVAGINEINAVIDNATTEFAQSLQAVADGDLTQRIDTAYLGRFAELKGAINDTVDRLAQTVRTIQLTSSDVGLAAREITIGADDLSKRTEEQASSLEQTAATTEELAASVKASAQASREAAAIADEAKQAAQAGGAIAGQAVDAMSRIESASQKISDIIRVIDDIAFQTNLLALNAAVEAARAGDAGKGFAVVASEVRTLAQRSGEAAKDIAALISSSNMEVGDGVKLVRQAGEALGRILTASQKVAATIADISAASGEQANGIDEMSQAVAHLDEMTQQNAALSEQSAASAASLSAKIVQLNDLVATFRTGQTPSDTQATPLQRRAVPALALVRPFKPASPPTQRHTNKVANSRGGDAGWEEF